MVPFAPPFCWDDFEAGKLEPSSEALEATKLVEVSTGRFLGRADELLFYSSSFVVEYELSAPSRTFSLTRLLA